MGRGFEVHDLQQQHNASTLNYHVFPDHPSAALIQTTAESVAHHCRFRRLNRLAVSTFLLHAKPWRVHHYGDHLKSKHRPDRRHIQSRLDERRSHRIPHGMKPAIWQPYSPG